MIPAYWLVAAFIVGGWCGMLALLFVQGARMLNRD